MMIARSFAVLVPLAAFASHFAHAFRHKIEATIDVVAATVDADSAFDVVNDSAAEDTTNDLGSTGRPPSTDKFTRAFEAVIAGKVQKHQATMAAAMEAMQNLGSATPGAPSAVSGKDNNTHKRNETLRLTNLLAEANVEKKRAEDIRAYATSMVQACLDLFGEVDRHSKDAQLRAKLVNEEGTRSLGAAVESIRMEVVQAESQDLTLLLAKVTAIQAAAREVVRLDKLVGAKAAKGISAATKGVYTLAGQLEARQEVLSSAQLEDWPELQSEGVKDEIDAKAQTGLQTARVKLDAILEEHANVFNRAMAQMNQLSASTKQSNLTDMQSLIQEQFQVNIQKANAQELGRAIDKTIELINAFFEILAGFREAVPIRMAAASKGASSAKVATARSMKDQIDKGDLQDISGFFYFYQVMWTTYDEAKGQMPKEDQDYKQLKREMKTLAESVHMWLNTEMMPFCDKHGTCQEVRGKLMAILEADNYWCGERDMKTCKTMKKGRQPNGKMCKWITPSDVGTQSYAHVMDGSSQGAWAPPGSGERPHCKQNNPPTSKLQFGRDSDSPGIFH